MANYYSPGLGKYWGKEGTDQAIGQTASTLYQQPGVFAGHLGGNFDKYTQGYGSYNQSLQGLGNNNASNYGAMAGAVAGLGQGLANTWNNAQSNNQATSAAEAARQVTIGNLGTAAMGAYGGIGQATMGAWGQATNGYQKAMGDIGTANQQSLGNLGNSRMGALSGLGKAGVAAGVGNDVAGAIPTLGGIGGTGGGGGYPTGYAPNSLDGSLRWLDTLRGDVNSQQDANNISNGYAQATAGLTDNQKAVNAMPGQFMTQSRNDLMGFNSLNLDASKAGMDQFYNNFGPGNQQRDSQGQVIPTASLLSALTDGYTTAGTNLNNVRSDLNKGFDQFGSAYGGVNSQVQSLFDNNLASNDAYKSAAQMQQQQMQQDEAYRNSLFPGLASGSNPGGYKMAW